jgi:hypothetical protein
VLIVKLKQISYIGTLFKVLFKKVPLYWEIISFLSEFYKFVLLNGGLYGHGCFVLKFLFTFTICAYKPTNKVCDFHFHLYATI